VKETAYSTPYRSLFPFTNRALKLTSCGVSGGIASPRSEAASDAQQRLDVHRRRDCVSGPALQVEAEDNENRTAHLQPCRSHGGAAAREAVIVWARRRAQFV